MPSHLAVINVPRSPLPSGLVAAHDEAPQPTGDDGAYCNIVPELKARRIAVNVAKLSRVQCGLGLGSRGSVHRETLHIHRPADFRDVYGGIGSDSCPYDAILDIFLALPPVPPELLGLRLHLACSGRLF